MLVKNTFDCNVLFLHYVTERRLDMGDGVLPEGNRSEVAEEKEE